MLVWITGLSGSGKTTLAEKIHNNLSEKNISSILLDGDQLRSILGYADTHYTPLERKKIAFCYARLCQMLSAQKHLVLMATISMFSEVRQWNRENNLEYLEVYLNIPRAIREHRSIKEVYTQNKNVVEIEAEFEEPQNPDIVFYKEDSLEEMVKQIIKRIT